MLKTGNMFLTSRRRRRLFVFLSLGACTLMTFLIWSRSSSPGKNGLGDGEDNNGNGKLGYHKGDPPAVHRGHIEEPERVLETPEEDKGDEIPDKVLQKRRKVIAENTDEFLLPVLESFYFNEVDLAPKRREQIDEYDEEIKEDIAHVKPGLGEKGEKATVPSYQTDVAETIMKKEAFNRLLSEMISPNRTVPDTREAACRSEVYDYNLPDMSVVIIFTNEAFTSLIRTIHSVFNRTPKRYLSEVILVDDFSDHRDLKGKLERYLAVHFPLSKLRLVRLHQRSGLIRARMIGAHLAAGEVLLFLDAHCEAIDGWAEPLLARIKEDRHAVVCPIIDVIDDKTMEYYHGNGEFFQIGGFTWSGHFTWINIPKYEAERKKNHHSPTRSPTMAGGLFAIDRRYFWEIGSYDSDMQLWGGENLEMSFRVWQCGGSVEIIPCSRVGHIFRNFHPYTFPNNVDSHGLNTARLAEVWMDDYKELFYSHRKELQTSDYGDVTKRKEFRRRKGCKSFKWFLDNVYKEKYQMKFDAVKYGQVKNPKTNQCFDNMQHTESEEYQLALYPCHVQMFPSQMFLMSSNGELRREQECASAGSGDRVQMVQCEHLRSNDHWEHRDNGELVAKRSDKCLTVSRDGDKYIPVLSTCKNLPEQQWVFNRFPEPDN